MQHSDEGFRHKQGKPIHSPAAHSALFPPQLGTLPSPTNLRHYFRAITLGDLIMTSKNVHTVPLPNYDK